jgi:hypothetical protein
MLVGFVPVRRMLDTAVIILWKPDQGVGLGYTLSSGGVMVVAFTVGGIMAFKSAGNRSSQTMSCQ